MADRSALVASNRSSMPMSVRAWLSSPAYSAVNLGMAANTGTSSRTAPSTRLSRSPVRPDTYSARDSPSSGSSAAKA